MKTELYVVFNTNGEVKNTGSVCNANSLIKDLNHFSLLEKRKGEDYLRKGLENTCIHKIIYKITVMKTLNRT